MPIRDGRFGRGLLAALLLAAAAPSVRADDMQDILEGFEEEPEAFEVEVEPIEEREPGTRTLWDRLDLTGSVALDATWNYRSHRSAGGVPAPPGTAALSPKQYEGLSRLRTKLNLQLDVDLVADWKARVSGFGYYDWAYRIDDRSDYSHHVLNDYESWYDVNELWLQGKVLRSLDLKLGRQIVNWGRSDSLRIVDVINPLDNREPGLVDIEDLRRPVGMARLDYYLGSWSVTAVVIPELRFDRNPPFGHDFNPSPLAIATDEPDHWGDAPEFGGAIHGIFAGWDVSFYGGRFVENGPVLEIDAPPPFFGFPPIVELRHGRFTMLGLGGNYTWGSWLVKSEIAFFDDRQVAVPAGFASLGLRRDRLDAMGGVEYYGFHDTTIALEIANRRIFDHAPALSGLVEKNSIETAIRYTADFMNQRLHTTILGLIFGEAAQDGSVVRVEGSYDLRDALVLAGGILLFQKGDSGLLETVGRNDRLFLQLKYSF